MATTTDGVEVRLGADTGEATSGVASAASSIQGSLDKLNSSMHDLGTKHADAVHQMVKSNEEAKDSFLGLSEAVRVRFGSINSAFEQFRTKLAGVAEAFAALALERESVKALTSFEDDVRGLEIAFGMSADQATRLSVALKLAGSDGTQYSEMLVRLGERMRTNQSEFTRLGVVINDSNGHLLDAQTILQNVYKRMQDFKAGSDQDLFVMDLLGRGAREFSDSMSRLAETQGRANELVQKFGISMGPEEQGNIERFRIETNAFKLVVEELSVRIGEQFLPGIERMLQAVVKAGPSFLELGTQASKAFSDIATGIVRTFSLQNAEQIDFLGSTLKALSLAIAGVREFAMDMLDAMAGGGAVLIHFAEGVQAAESALDRLDFSGAIAAVKRMDAQIVADTRDTIAKMKGEYEQWQNDRDAILFGRKPEASGPPTAASRATAGLPASGTGTYTPPPPKGSGGDDRLAAWKDELVQMQEAEGYFHEMSKEQEAEFWQAKLALVTGYGKEEVRLRRELTKMIFDDRKAEAQKEYQEAMATFQREIDGAKNNRDQQIKDAEARTAFVKATFGEESAAFQRSMDEETRIRDAWAKKDEALVQDAAKHRMEMATLEIEGETHTLDYEVALRQVSSDQKYAIEQQLEDRLYELKLKGLQDTLATLQQGTIAYQKEAEKIEALEVQHQQKLTDIARQAELERRRDELQATQDFQNDFASALASVADGTKSLKQAFLDFFKQLDQQLSQLAANKIAQQLFGPGTSGGGFVQGIMGKIFGEGAAGGGAAGASAEAAATQATTAAMTQLTAATTTQGTTFNLLDSVSTLLQTAFQALASAAQSASSALLSMGGGGGGLGGIGDMFGGFGSSDLGGLGGFGGMFGFPMFAAGTPYVPRDMLAIIHKGEAIIPAGMNRPGGNTSSYAVHNYFNIAGGADARSQGQIAAAAFHGMQIAARRHS